MTRSLKHIHHPQALVLYLAAAFVGGSSDDPDACSNSIHVDLPFGASLEEGRTMQARDCSRWEGHVYFSVSVSWPVSSLHPESFEEVGACIPPACLGSDADGGSAVDHKFVMWMQSHLRNRCRDAHPTLYNFWPGEVDNLDSFGDWRDRMLGRFGLDQNKFFTWGSITECPSAACGVIAGTVTMVESVEDLLGKTPSDVAIDNIERLVNTCYEELLSDTRQLQLFGKYGFNLGIVEVAQTKLRTWMHQIRPRNPHQDDNRLVWRDHYSGVYSPVDYAVQFDLQWHLALNKSRGFADESSTRLDDCALNDMIQSTFGERNFLKDCDGDKLRDHEEKERGIAKRNFMLFDITPFLSNSTRVLDVGCGFGRWTAMMSRLGANVTSVDASPHAVESTRRYNPHQTYQMTLFDLANVPGYAEGFDFVVCWGVLHHTHDPLAGFKIVSSAVREGGMLFVQIYSDQSKAAFPFVYRLRDMFHSLKTTEEQVQFLRQTHAAAGADVFDHLDGMLTFYNWAIHEETVRQWFFDLGFADYWKVWNYKYAGRKRPLGKPVRDDTGLLLSTDLGESQLGVPYYPVQSIPR